MAAMEPRCEKFESMSQLNSVDRALREENFR